MQVILRVQVGRVLVWAFLLVGLMLLPLARAEGQARNQAARPALPPPDFFVSPQGDDAWTGRQAEPDQRGAGPFQTLMRASEAVRAVRAAEPDRARPVVVGVMGGFYELERPWVLGPLESGTAASPTIFAALPGHEPWISGGVRIGAGNADRNGRRAWDLPAVRDGDWRFRQLFVNGRRRDMTRLPERGYYHTTGRLEPTGQSTRRGDDRFIFPVGSINPAWAESDDVNLMIFHLWYEAHLPIRSVDAESRTVTLRDAMGARDWIGRINPGSRFLAQNVPEAVGQPGRFFLDHGAGRLTYAPERGERLGQRGSTVVAPRLPRLLVIEGREQDGERVRAEHIHFYGLTFAHTNFVLPPMGFSVTQAAHRMEAAVSLWETNHIKFQQCRFTQLAGYGMNVRTGSDHTVIEQNTFTDLGAGGIMVGPAYPGGNFSNVPVGTIIRDNLIAHGGRTHPSAVGVWVGHARDARVEYNQIIDFYYTGISLGWSWGYAPTGNHGNIIAHNRISTIGQGVLSDMGGIYTLGLLPECVVRGNVITDIESVVYGGWGIYLDEGTSDLLVENNVVMRTIDGGINQHFGRENRVINNVFGFARETQIGLARPEEHISWIFERNLVLWERGQMYRMPHGLPKMVKKSNLYWGFGDPARFDGHLLEAWQQMGHEAGSIEADPGLTILPDGRFRLRRGSPALRVGFEPFEVVAGPRGQRPYTFSETDFPRTFDRAIPLDGFVERFDDTSVGQPPAVGRVIEEDERALVRVVERAGPGGGRSLRFTDVPGQQHHFNPHWLVQPNIRSGPVRGRWSLWHEGGTRVVYEWRTRGHPFKIGPRIEISADGLLRAGGRELQLPLRGWVQMEILFTPANDGGGLWLLETRLPDGRTERWADLPVAEGYSGAHVLVIGAWSDAAGAFEIDDVAVEPAAR